MAEDWGPAQKFMAVGAVDILLQPAIDHRGKARGDVGGEPCGEGSGDDVHGVVGAEDEDDDGFAKGDGDGGGTEPPGGEVADFNGTEDGEGGVAGEEEVIADAVGDEGGGEAGVPPDMPGGGGRVQQSWEICRRLKTMSMARKGAKLGPKMARAMRVMPRISIKKELRARARLADRSWVRK